MTNILKNNDKVAVYTAIFRQSSLNDKLHNPIYKDKNFDFFCFTDCDDLIADSWKIIKVKREKVVRTSWLGYDYSPALSAKKYKILPHLYFPNYKYSIWIDGSYSIKGDIRGSIIREEESIKKASPLMFYAHPLQECLYEEAKYCIENKKEKPEIIMKQIDCYKRAGMPKNFGCVRGAVIFREHNNPIVIQAMESWWREIMSYSVRDQISFPYVAWKMKEILEYHLMENDSFPKYFKAHSRKFTRKENEARKRMGN